MRVVVVGVETGTWVTPLTSAEVIVNWSRRRKVKVVRPSMRLRMVNVLLPAREDVAGKSSRSRLQWSRSVSSAASQAMQKPMGSSGFRGEVAAKESAGLHGAIRG